MGGEHRFFFVTGAPKSGTTWLQLLLDKHPEILCKGEGSFHDFGRALSRAAGEYNNILKEKNTRIFGEELFPPLRREEFQGLFRCFVRQRLEAEIAKPGVTLIGNKEPDHGQHLGIMAEAFPEAPFVHILRDGRDVAVSAWFHNKRFDPGKAASAFPDFQPFMEHTAKLWGEWIRKIRATAAQKGLRYMEVRYEALLADAPGELTRILAFLGAAADPAVVAACVAQASFKALTGGRDHGQEDAASFFRKGVAGDWRNHMDDRLAEAFDRITGGLLRELGYA